jgi:uncharacterized protein YbjT (DUF2867 family)
MKIVVIGGTGLIGSKVIPLLRAKGHDAIAAAPDTGVNTLTGEGLDAALVGADVVVDLANSRSFEPPAALAFFTAHEKNLLAAELRAGVRHHVALSIVGVDRSPENGYFRAKIAQEELIKGSGVPYTIIRSTQFMEFLPGIADANQRDGMVDISTGLFQPIAADDVAQVVAEVAMSPPLSGAFEIAGPDRAPFADIVRRYLEMTGDARHVHPDPDARFYGAKVEQLSLVPTGEAKLGATSFADWIEHRPQAH